MQGEDKWGGRESRVSERRFLLTKLTHIAACFHPRWLRELGRKESHRGPEKEGRRWAFHATETVKLKSSELLLRRKLPLPCLAS